VIYQKSKAKSSIADQKELNDIVSRTLSHMAEIVGRTLGPGGRPVIIEREDLAPLATKDGVTVAKALGAAISEENIIIDAAKEICINTAKEAGDGTTTAIVLADALVKNGQKFLTANPKCNPQQVIRELQNAYNKVICPLLADLSIDAKTEEQLLQVATISANGDADIAAAAVEAVMDAGDDGTVLIVEGQDNKTVVETAEGYVITTGLKELGQIGPAFINDNAAQAVNMDSGRILLYNGMLNDLTVPSMIQDALTDEHGQSDGKPIIVLAHGFSDTVLEVFAKHTKGGQTVLPLKTPRSGLPNGGHIFMNDMAAYTGGRVYDPGNISELDEMDMGTFTSATSNMYESFIDGDGEQVDVDNRIVELKAIMESALGELDKHHLRAHIAKLTGGVSTVVVGGSSDLEIREKKGRVEDAVEAVRSAIAEGVVPGGCSMQVLIEGRLSVHPDKTPAWQILIDSLSAPFNLLLSNCGEDIDSVRVAYSPIAAKAIQARSLPDQVFDANSHTLVDPIQAGIIEPAKVCRVSIGNALSVAGLLTTLGGIVVVPRDVTMEQQKELADHAFKSMMDAQ
jgi:chaperonin GroEL